MRGIFCKKTEYDIKDISYESLSANEGIDLAKLDSFIGYCKLRVAEDNPSQVPSDITIKDVVEGPK